MAQTLAVYHYGYHTLKAGQVQSHEPAMVPSDAAAVLDWNLGVPFTSLDKPPLAIAMIVTINGERSLRRYRLVIAQKSKLRLTPEVLATFCITWSRSSPHCQADSSLVPLIGNTCMVMLRMDTARHSGCVLPITDTRS